MRSLQADQGVRLTAQQAQLEILQQKLAAETKTADQLGLKKDGTAPVEVKTVEEVFVRTSMVIELRVRDRIVRTTGEHPFFVREGNDLHCVVPLSVTQAAMGAEIRVPTLEGEHTLKIPDGTQPGTTFRVRNKGVPVLSGHGKGDLYVEVRVQIPSKLSKRQKELLQELETTTKVDNQPMMRSLLGKMKDMFG